MPNYVLDFDGCGDGDRTLQANGRWSGSFYSVSTSYGAFGYGTQILSGGTASRAFEATNHPLVGWHMNTRVNDNPSTGHKVEFREGAFVNCYLLFPSSGKVEVYDALGVKQGEIAGGIWPFQAWSYIEVEVNVSNIGYVKIWLFGNNDIGAPDLFLDGIDTQHASGTGVCDNMRWLGVDGNTHWIDDWYLMDGNIAAVGLGGAVIGAVVPAADDTVEWTPSGAGGNFQQVNERPFSGTDNVSTSVDGEKDLYTVTDEGSEAEVFAVRVIGQMKKSDASLAQARLILDDGTQADGETRALSITSLVYADVFTTQPGGGEWDPASVDALKIGVERVAP